MYIIAAGTATSHSSPADPAFLTTAGLRPRSLWRLATLSCVATLKSTHPTGMAPVGLPTPCQHVSPSPASEKCPTLISMASLQALMTWPGNITEVLTCNRTVLQHLQARVCKQAVGSCACRRWARHGNSALAVWQELVHHTQRLQCLQGLVRFRYDCPLHMDR